jgi:acetylornithine deacetylase/succinyl-diaminopimelate desuccinylase-like protein
MRKLCALLVLLAAHGAADDNRSLSDRTRQYATDLIRLDTSNPPGNETRVAEYLKQIADNYNIPAELVGADPRRMNFIARLKGTGKNRPLLLIAHSDVVPAERNEWSADPFSAEIRQGILYGRGAIDDKGLLAAELAVMIEIKRRNVKLDRDIILVSESDEEIGSSGIQWLIQHAPAKIDSEFALNEGGAQIETKDGMRMFEIQTAEKVPSRMLLTARGTSAHGSLPRADNPLLHLSRALVKLAEAEQPVKLNPTTRRFFRDLSRFPEYNWLQPILPKLENSLTAQAAANQIRAKDPELDAMLHTTVTATILRAGNTINVIPTHADAQLDVRRLPSETREEILARFRQIVSDSAIELSFAPGQQMPSTDPSPQNTALYRAMERAINNLYLRETTVVPMMSRGATDGGFLRAHGIPTYGVPIFLREPGESRAHGNDERIALKTLDDGVELLWQIVLEVAGAASP